MKDHPVQGSVYAPSVAPSNPRDRRYDLDGFIAPITRQEFFDRYWEREHFHLARRDADFYRSLFSLDDVDRWIASAPYTGDNKLTVRSSEGMVVRRGPAGTFDPATICDDVADGHTLILQAVHESWPPLQAATVLLERALSARTRVNLYLSPPGSKGFDRHIDYHDFFIFQVHGSKHWHLFEKDYLPMERLEYGPFAAFQQAVQRGTAPLEEIHLRQGDLLYVPRGMPHYAAAIEETSLHLTVSFHPLFWTDLLKAAVEGVAVGYEPLQRSLPPGFLADPERRRGMAARFAECLAEVAHGADFDLALEAAGRHLTRELLTETGGRFTAVARLGELSPDHELERPDGMACVVENEGGSAVIRGDAGLVRGPAALLPVLEFVRDHPRFRLGELPGLKDAGRIALTRRLIRGGLLRVVDG